MFYTRMLTLILVSLLFALTGCGVVDEEYEGAARLVVTSVTDGDGNTPLYFYANLGTDDDPDPDVEDEPGEGDGFPQDGEAVTKPLEVDVAKFSFFNEPRLGVDNPVDLVIQSFHFIYRDAYGNKRSFAPDLVVEATGLVPAEGTLTLPVTLIPQEMKIPTGGGGLSDIVLLGISQDGLYGDPATEFNAAAHWTIDVEIRAKDYKNNDIIKVYDRIEVAFFNAMVWDLGEDLSGE